jgi:hypothetical protein
MVLLLPRELPQSVPQFLRNHSSQTLKLFNITTIETLSFLETTAILDMKLSKVQPNSGVLKEQKLDTKAF